MKLGIFHQTRYDYESPVELNPHTLFLKPLQRPHLRTSDHRLKISPVPKGLAERQSIEGNPFFQAWFSGQADSLQIDSTFEVAVRPFNPFEFILDHDFIARFDPQASKAFSYSEDDGILLHPALQTTVLPDLDAFAGTVLERAPDEPIVFLKELTASIHEHWKHIIRTEENLWSPAETFAAGEGSCRDLSWMMIHMLRMQGLGARFVSGYAYNPEIDEGHELHAWVEVYLPGAGWLGVDPSLGLFADQYYIPLACSAHAHHTLPVHGNYGGTAGASLSTQLEITATP